MSRHSSVIRTAATAIAVLTLALLGGCASSRPALLMDHTQAQQIECHGLFGSWEGCRTEALAVCSSGTFQILSRNRHDGASEAEVEARTAGNAFHERRMLVRCGEDLPLSAANG